jgi:hypothetical protein
VRDLWPGITLRLSGDRGRVKSEYIVEPGVRPDLISVRFHDAVRVGLNPEGGLEVETGGGVWTEEAPQAWFEGGKEAPVAFRLRPDGSVGFDAPDSSAARLIIDPAISYSGVFGGSGASAATAMAIDAAGSIYLGGYTDAYDFPQTGAILPRGGGVDGIVLKLERSTGRLLWANYLGGAGDDRVHALVLGADGGVYAAGATTSVNFPAAGAMATSHRGGSDAFVLKFTADGAQLVFSNYLGGTQTDSALALAAASAGVWAGGQTSSTNFPVQGALQTALRGATDGFIAKYSAGGALESSTYFGGSGDDLIRAMTASSTGDVYAGGSTGSADLAFPVGAFQPALAGAIDGFVVKLAASGGQIIAGTYLGGSSGTAGAPERVEALAVDAALNVYAAGYTPSGNFPTPGAWLGTLGGVRDGFLVKLHPGLNGQAWGTFMGGGGQDMIQSMALLPDGRIAVAGATTSVNLPLQDAIVGSYRGSTDGFVSVFTPDGASVPFSSYLGGSASDTVFAVAAGPGNSIVAAGQSGSADLPLRGPAPAPVGSALRFFVTQVALGAAPRIESVSPSAGSGAGGTFEAVATHASGASHIAVLEIAFGDLLSGASSCRVRWSTSAGKLWVVPETGATSAMVTPGESGVSVGPMCTLSAGASSVSMVGTMMTVRVSLTFQRPFAGLRTISANATASDQAESGYAVLGGWTVTTGTNAAPAVVSVTSPVASGSSAVFSVTASDGNGSGDLARLRLLIGSSASEAGSCAAEYDRAAGQVRLVNDTASGWFAAPVASGVTLVNSSCQLRVATTAATLTSSTLRVDFDVVLSASMAGSRNVYAMAADSSGAATAYQQFGTFQVTLTNNLAPQLVSLTPSTAAGSLQRFTLIYADNNGAADIALVRMRINSAQQDAGGCSFEVERATGALRLRDDAGTQWLSTAIGSSQPAANSQCEVRAASATLTFQSAQLTLSVEIAFLPAFNGTRTIWTSAEDVSAATAGWYQAGSYLVAAVLAQAPVALSVSPPTGSGTGVTLTVAWTDVNGAQDIRTARVLVNSEQRASGACYVSFDRQSLSLSLADDSGAAWSQATAGTAATLSNSQCTVHAAGTVFALSGAQLLVNFQLSFKGAFNGAKSIWANATDLSGLTSDSPWLGSYTVAVPVNQPPAAVSITPASGSGAAQVFSAVWSDPNGGTDIARAEVLIHSVQSAAWACYVQVRPAQGTLALAADEGGGWITVQAGSAATASNSQCILRGAGSSIQVTGTSMFAQLDIGFKPGFNGAKSIWANAVDAAELYSSSPLLGSYTVAAMSTQPPVPTSVSPSTGSGGGQVMQFVWTDANGAEDVVWARVLINSVQQAGGGCYFVIDRAARTVTLADDGGTLSQTARLGTADTAGNSQCDIHGQGSSLQAVGTTLSSYIDVRFKAPFNGLKGVWMNATDQAGLTSASPQLGSYNVSSSSAAVPAPTGVSPAASSGSRQTFTFTWTDANGAHDIALARVLVHSVQQADAGCYLQVEPLYSRVLLANDAATSSQALLLGSPSTVQNSQCQIHGAGSWLIVSGNTLTAILDISFRPAFAGAKSIWMNATDAGGLTSPSPLTGSYTVLP